MNNAAAIGLAATAASILAVATLGGLSHSTRISAEPASTYLPKSHYSLESARDVDVKQLNDENEMLKVVNAGLMTGPKGAKFGSAGFVVNCSPVAYIDEAPLKDTAKTDFQQIP